MESWKEHVGVDFVAQAHDYASRLPDWLRENVKIK